MFIKSGGHAILLQRFEFHLRNAPPSRTPPRPTSPQQTRPPWHRQSIQLQLATKPCKPIFDDTAVYHDIMIRKQHWKTCWSCPSFKTIPMWFMNNSRTRWTPPLTRWRVQERAPGRTWEATRASPGKDPLAVTPVTTSTTWTSTRTQTTHTYMWALWTLQYSCCVRFM